MCHAATPGNPQGVSGQSFAARWEAISRQSSRWMAIELRLGEAQDGAPHRRGACLARGRGWFREGRPCGTSPRSARSIRCVGRSRAAGPAKRMRGAPVGATAIDSFEPSSFRRGLRCHRRRWHATDRMSGATANMQDVGGLDVIQGGFARSLQAEHR